MDETEVKKLQKWEELGSANTNRQDVYTEEEECVAAKEILILFWSFFLVEGCLADLFLQNTGNFRAETWVYSIVLALLKNISIQ